MKYRLTILPALEVTTEHKEFYFESRVEVLAAKNTAADLLLYLQDDLDVMPDYSNIVTAGEKIDGEWHEIED